MTLLNDRLGETIIFPLLPFLLERFTSSGSTLGLLAGTYAISQFAAAPLIGAMSDRFGRKPVITTCVAGSVIGLLIFALTVTIDWQEEKVQTIDYYDLDNLENVITTKDNYRISEIAPIIAFEEGIEPYSSEDSFLPRQSIIDEVEESNINIEQPIYSTKIGIAGISLPLFLLFFARVIDGASGGTAATATAILADISTPENRAKTFGLIGVAFGLGFVLGPGLGTTLSQFSVTLPVWAGTAFAISNLALVIWILPETLPIEKRNSLPRKRELNPFTQLKYVFENPLSRRLCLAFFIFFMAFNGFTAVLVLYLKDAFNWGPGLSSNAFIVVGVIAMIVQGGLIGPLVNKFGEWRLTIAGTGFVTAGCILLTVAKVDNSIETVFPAVGILAIGTGLVTPCLRALISRRLSESGQGAVLGSLQGLQSLGTFLGATAAGICYDIFGQKSPFFVTTALLIMVIILVAGNSFKQNKVISAR